MKYKIQNIYLAGNEHGQLKANIVYAELVTESGEIAIKASGLLGYLKGRNNQGD